MNWADLILVLIVLLAVIAGWYRGFIASSLALLTWAGSFVIAYLFYPYMAGFLDRLFDAGPWLQPIAFILTAVLAGTLLSIIAGFISCSIPAEGHLNGVNKFLGIFPGAITGYLYAIIFSALFLALPIKEGITKEIRNSRLGVQLAMQSEWANRKLAPVFDEAIRQTINSLTVKPGSAERVNLTFKVNNAVPRQTYETEMLQMVNQERQKHGLKPLQPDPEMRQVARAHSQDMFARGYFAHDTPEGKDPFDRMRAANVRFATAGENLALAQTVEIAHVNLMNSPGHRANILNPSFGRVGIGILDGGFYGLMISQEFRD
ncbi:MAG TPA: CvpA family protein [Chitinophagaceae bacterium]|nr:CvpA family protein [Chitinophagaceae bacterium]